MIRLEVPIRGRRLLTTGDLLLRAELVLSLKNSRGNWHDALFLVDSGTEMSTMSAAEAHRHDLPLPRRSVPGLHLHGQEVRAGLLRVRIVGLDATEYDIPCYFLGDPSVPPLLQPRNLVGLSGVIHQIYLGFDGRRSVGAPYGSLIVEKP